MLLAKLLAPDRHLARCLGSGAPPTRGVLQQLRAATFFASDPGAAAHEPPHWHRQQQSILQRASRQHGIASNSTTRQKHSSRRGKPPSSVSPASNIRALGKQKRWQDALHIFNAISEPTALEVKAVLEAMALSHQHGHAAIAMKQLRALSALTAQDYEFAVRASIHRYFNALSLLRAMERDGTRWTQRACGAALLACGKAGRLDDALQLIGKMTKLGIRPNRVSYLDLIGHCVRDERSEDRTHAGDSRGGSKMAMKLLQLMEDQGLAPDVQHFGAALKVCARERNPGSGSTIFQLMATQGIVPDLQSWNTLLDAIGRAGEVDAMLAKSYTSRINCYATAMEPEKSEKVLAEMCQAGNVKPDVVVFNSLMKAYIVAERLDAAEHVISRMRAAGVQPSLPTWKSIIHAADTAGDVKRADRLYNDALLSGTIKPYRPWRSSVNRDASGNKPAKGTVMDLHLSGTGRAAIRHELHQRQKDAGRCKLPLYIITGHCGGQMVAAVSGILKSQSVLFLLQPGVVVVPSPDAR